MLVREPGDALGKVLGIISGSPSGCLSGNVDRGLVRTVGFVWPTPFALAIGVRNLFINGGGSARRRVWLGGGGLSEMPLEAPCVYEAIEALDSAGSMGKRLGCPESLPRMRGAGGHSLEFEKSSLRPAIGCAG